MEGSGAGASGGRRPRLGPWIIASRSWRPWEQASSRQPPTRNGPEPVMNRGSSDPLSEAPPSPRPPPPPLSISPGVVGEAAQPSSEDQAGWRKPSKVARKASKGKDPVVSSESGEKEPGPLAIVPVRMELASASPEATERAMVDPDSMALKRARSPSPEEPEGGRLLVAAPKKGPRPARPARKQAHGQQLLLLPPTPSTAALVCQSTPCMVKLPEREGKGGDVPTPSLNGTLVSVPVEEGGKRRGGRGGKTLGRRSEREGEESSGVGGPIRRPKSRGAAATGKGGASVRAKKKRVGEGTGGQKGGDDAAGEGPGQSTQARVSPRRGSPGGVAGRGKGPLCSGGTGTGKGAMVRADVARVGRGACKEGASPGKGKKVESISPGGGKGRNCYTSGGKALQSAASPTSRAVSRSPMRRRGNLFGGGHPGEGREGEEKGLVMPGHGDLVELVKGAVRVAEGGEGVEAGGIGGGDLGEPSEL